MITTKTSTINRPETIETYVTSDGREFKEQFAARRHEASITPARKITSKEIYILMDDVHVTAFYIPSKDDVEYLITINYWDNWDDSHYSEPGWYICFVQPGGDHRDLCTLIKAEDYIKKLEDSINEIKKVFT